MAWSITTKAWHIPSPGLGLVTIPTMCVLSKPIIPLWLGPGSEGSVFWDTPVLSPGPLESHRTELERGPLCYSHTSGRSPVYGIGSREF